MSEETQETPVETQEEVPMEKPGPRKVPSLYRNYISFAGTAIALASLLCIVFLFVIELNSAHEQPYLGIFTFILFPAIMIFGLFIVVVGILFERRRRRKSAPTEIAAFPILDFNNPRQRRTFLVVLCAAFLFLFYQRVRQLQGFRIFRIDYFLRAGLPRHEARIHGL